MDWLDVYCTHCTLTGWTTNDPIVHGLAGHVLYSLYMDWLDLYCKIDRFHLPLHHMTEQKFHLLVAATTLLKFLRFLFPRTFRYLSDTHFLIFKIFYCAKWRELLGLSSHKVPSLEIGHFTAQNS
jgi:hypothetical protein